MPAANLCLFLKLAASKSAAAVLQDIFVFNWSSAGYWRAPLFESAARSAALFLGAESGAPLGKLD